MLRKSPVVFDAENHTYTLDGKKLSGITGMLERQIFPDKYKDVPPDVMAKAAERGSLIHAQCQVLDDSGIDMGGEETEGYLALKEAHALQYVASEYLVSDEAYFASCIDKVYAEGGGRYSLGDIKTTYTLDREYLRWQLSIYAHFFELQNPGTEVVNLYGIWLRGGTHQLAKVERIPAGVVGELLQCEVEGRQFNNPYAAPPANTLPGKYLSMADTIRQIDSQARYWAEKKKELVDGVTQEMVGAGVYKWEGDGISFTRRKESIRKVFDAKAFEKDHPGLYQQYLKESPTAGSVTLKVV